MKPKILFSGEFPRTKNYSGSYAVNTEILTYLVKSELFEIRALSPIFKGEKRPHVELPVEFVEIPYWRSKSPSDLGSRFTYTKIILEKIRDFKPDIVHVDAFPRLSNHIPPHIPSVLFLHGSITQSITANSILHPYSFIVKILESMDEKLTILNPNVKKIFINSIFSKNALISGHNISKSQSEKIEAVRLGYNVERFRNLLSKEEAAQKIHQKFGKTGPFLLFVGGVSDHKGQRDLVQILPQIVSRWPEVLLIITGKDAGDLEYCKNKARELGVGKNVVFTGSLKDEGLGIVFKGADIYVSAAQEGFGINQVEAMGMGLPLVAMDRGAVRELFQDSEQGFLVSNSNELADKINLLISRPELRIKMGMSAEKHAKQIYSWDSLGKHIILAYLDILGD